MANHRRNRTTRREVKRLDSKAFRMAEKRGAYRNPRTDMWGRGPDLPVPDDAPSNGSRRSKRRRPKKDRCSVNRKHEWYREWVEKTDFYRRTVHNCETCATESEKWIKQRSRWAEIFGYELDTWRNPYNPRWCNLHGEKVYYTTRTKIATCIHCGVSKREAYETDRWNWRSDRKRVLPKRTVKF